MSLNPLNELKRRLQDDSTPLPKRLCLAKNIVHSHHFPTAPKERIVADWLDELMVHNKLSGELQRLMEWLNGDDMTGELKGKLIQVVSQFVQKNILQSNEIHNIIVFLENPKITGQLCQQIDDFLSISTTLLQCLINDEKANPIHSQKILHNYVKYYKESKKKLEFIVKFLQGEHLEIIFSYLDTDCRSLVIEMCQNILFPINKKTFFISYLQTLIRKDNIEELIAEKGDNIQSVLKIMSIFFDYPKHRTEMDPKFLRNFIDVFVSCFKTEHQIVFAFFIMVANVLKMEQNYIVPSMDMRAITFDENDDKIKRNLFLSMLEIVLKNEIDINVRLTDTFGEKISKVEIKKNFLLFLQEVMMGQLKLEGKLDKVTLQIVKTALKLDPILVEQKMNEILPPIMASKKSFSSLESYKEMLKCLLEILFKLSRGTSFFNKILPSVKSILDAGNTEQIELEKKMAECIENGTDCEKVKNKLIASDDIFPQDCVELFGKLTTDLMFRQNKELLESLQKDFEVHCLVLLEEGIETPSVIVLSEVLSAILSSFLRHNKMADHTVSQNIAEDFWNVYTSFELDFLRKFGQCVIKIRNNCLLKSYLKVCTSYAELKLLNIKYCNYKVNVDLSNTDGVYNLTMLLPCLTIDEWEDIAKMAESNDAIDKLDHLILLKTMAIEILSASDEAKQALIKSKTHLIKELNSNYHILENDKCFPRALFANLDKKQYAYLAKTLVKLYLNGNSTEIFSDVAISNNKLLLNALVLEVAKNITKSLNNCETLAKALNKEFKMAEFAKEVNMINYFNEITSYDDEEKIKNCIELLKLLKLPYLEENYQLTAIFVLLATKKCSQPKKIRKSIDYVLQSIFELSFQAPDLYQVFPVEYIFSFTDTILLDLLVLKIKNNQLLVLKSLAESAIKRFRSESHLIKDIVELLLNKNHDIKTIDVFGDTAFQICCIILPLIVKHRKVTTRGAHRSILADLQEKLLKNLLDTFNSIDFKNVNFESGNPDDSMIESGSDVAALNAISAYTLTLAKYCETTDADEIKKLDCLWSGLEFFTRNAIKSVENPNSKTQNIESSIQLLNIILRYTKKLDPHPIFDGKDKLFTQIWQSIIARLKIFYHNGSSLKNCGYLEELNLALRFLCELVSVDTFAKFISDLKVLVDLKKPTEIIKDTTKSDVTNHMVAKYLWIQCLKANTIGPKCNTMAKTFYQISRNLITWIRQHYDSTPIVANNKKRKLDIYSEDTVKIVKVDDSVCEILRVDLETLSEVIFAGKKIIIDYKFLDSIFELQQMIQYTLGLSSSQLRCEITWQSFFTLYEGSVAILNSLLVSREEILEDRWPCYMQCYRALTTVLCERSTFHSQLDKHIEERLAEMAFSIEKLTQLITKRKKQLSRIAAYSVADICTNLEKNAPSRMVRQHLENSVSMLIQASDSSYSMAFLRRALAGSVGQMTMTNLYTMYKRYHKYTGNA